VQDAHARVVDAGDARERVRLCAHDLDRLLRRSRLLGDPGGEAHDRDEDRCGDEDDHDAEDAVEVVRAQTDGLDGIGQINDSGVRVLHAARALRKVAVGK
jgi:hypothetical protein